MNTVKGNPFDALLKLDNIDLFSGPYALEVAHFDDTDDDAAHMKITLLCGPDFSDDDCCRPIYVVKIYDTDRRVSQDFVAGCIYGDLRQRLHEPIALVVP